MTDTSLEAKGMGSASQKTQAFSTHHPAHSSLFKA